jgi:hypothetical protein
MTNFHPLNDIFRLNSYTLGSDHGARYSALVKALASGRPGILYQPYFLINYTIFPSFSLLNSTNISKKSLSYRCFLLIFVFYKSENNGKYELLLYFRQ